MNRDVLLFAGLAAAVGAVYYLTKGPKATATGNVAAVDAGAGAGVAASGTAPAVAFSDGVARGVADALNKYGPFPGNTGGVAGLNTDNLDNSPLFDPAAQADKVAQVDQTWNQANGYEYRQGS